MSNRTKKPWEQSLGPFLEEVVARNPGKTFIEIGGLSKTYQEFYDGVRKAAAMFAGLGIQKEDRVCLFLPNCIEYVYSWFGLSLIGAISVPVNTAYKRDEMAYILTNAEAKALVTDPSLADVAGAAAELAPSVVVKLLRGVEGTVPDGWTDYSVVHDTAEPLVVLPEISPHDVSMLVYTSGTTGNPKG
ncbi:MAG: AMP-binding protein, partial [Chloroflexota bacterium]|nr:AMP-binding protein [Chloroflexota bacterium]